MPASTLAVVALLLASGPDPAPAPAPDWERTEVMVPMRDGVRLQTVIYTPGKATASGEKLPILLMRTPYGFSEDGRGHSRWLTAPWLRPMLDDGYVLVLQNVRGRFRSEGTYVMESAPRDRSDPRSVDEGTDAHDTVEWLVSRVPSNGRVGILGVSIPGRLVAMAMLEHHPAVKAYSPQATPADNFIGDDLFHQGAFRLSQMFDFIPAMETGPAFTSFAFDRLDLHDWFLELGPLGNVDARHFHGRFPMWNAIVAHPTYDAYWKRRSLPAILRHAPAPTLHVGGAFDQEDRRGPVALYAAMEANDAEGWNFLVQGPWAHRTWRLSDGDRLGRVAFGSATGKFFREEVQAPFFACHLKGRCGAPLPEALVFQTGSNVWQRLPAWPPRGGQERSLYLAGGGGLSFDPPVPGAREAVRTWTSDPASPVPYQARPVPAPNMAAEAAEAAWPVWMLADQRFVHGRPDVVSWQTAPLTEDVVLSGSITAHLFVSTTGTDADFVAKLIDVQPEVVEGDPTLGGAQIMVAAEIRRGRFRKGFERSVPFTPGKVEEVAIDLLTRNHVFRKGHRIMVQVQSTWFPLYDRNPQTFVPSIFQAKEADFRAHAHRIHSSSRHPSRVTFQVPD
ncbi:MAG: X-Pro dipeptidyl-peptidase [Anaeromyxobacteraceae bacterium]|nr:X-Pro dipeptidyl-peptidase [Anaeromyxobacteraceae bacterium]